MWGPIEGSSTIIYYVSNSNENSTFFNSELTGIFFLWVKCTIELTRKFSQMKSTEC